MESLHGYESERKKFISLLHLNKAVLIYGDSGTGKTFFVHEVLKSEHYQIIDVPVGKAKDMGATVLNFHTKRSPDKLVFVFDSIEDSIKFDKGKRKSSKKNKNIVHKTVEEYFGEIVLHSRYPVVFIAQSKGDGRSKDRVPISLSRIAKMTTPIELGIRDYMGIQEILKDKEIPYDETLQSIYQKYKGNISRIIDILLGGQIYEQIKTLSAQDFIMFTCSPKKEEAYKYILSKQDREIPTLFLLAWSSRNAFKILPHSSKEAAQFQQIICQMDMMKYGGVRNSLLGSFVQLLPEKRYGKLSFPNMWKTKKFIKVEETTKEKEEKPKLRHRTIKLPKKRTKKAKSTKVETKPTRKQRVLL